MAVSTRFKARTVLVINCRCSVAAITALALTSSPAFAETAEIAQDAASDLVVMTIKLKDIVEPQVGVQAQTQAAGTPSQAGLRDFLPLVVDSNSVYLANASLKDQGPPAGQKNVSGDGHAGVGRASVTRINGAVPPGKPTRAAKSTTLIDVILDGRRRLVFRDERQKGTRAPIHEHPYGGLTCMIAGEMTLYLEGSKPQTATPGNCYWMPPGRPMSGVNSGDETAVLLDIFDVPLGKGVWRVVEDGQESLEQNFDKASSSTN